MNLQPQLLINEKVKLVPLVQDDFERLFEIASDPLVWEQHPNKNRYQRSVFENFFAGALASKGAFIALDSATHQVVGSTRFYDYDAKTKQVLIGYTFLGRNYWGKGYNAAMKRLMLNYAFEFVERVIFHVGAENIRSQKAMAKLGALKIGEELIAYFGEPEKLNFVYLITKQQWNT
jgi:RimJ/RimL family protein N-acetyltransferase